MRARLCAAILAFEAILLGLSTPVMISVEDVDPAVAVPIGIGLMLLCIVVAGMLRRPGGMLLGHLIQVASIALGLLVPVMFFVGGLFATLWVTAYVLGGRIDTDRAAWADFDERDDSTGTDGRDWNDRRRESDGPWHQGDMGSSGDV